MDEIHFQQWFAEEPEQLFDRFHRHSRLGEIYPAQFVRVQDGDGPDVDGAGSVREIRAPGLRFREEVTVCRVPDLIEYRIVDGVPVIRHHLGIMRFQPVAGGTLLDYRMQLAFRLPGNRIWATLMKHLVWRRMRRLANRIKQEK